MSNPKQTICIIGMGFIGKIHLKTIKKLKKIFTFKGYYDPNVKKFKNFKSFKNIEEIISYNPNFVLISTPSNTHLNIATKLVKKGIKNIIIEKPLAFKKKHIENLILLERKYNCKIFPVSQLLFNDNLVLLKKILDQKLLGKIVKVNIISLINRNKGYFLNSKWKGKFKYDGGILFNQFYHFIDIINYFFPYKKKIYGKFYKNNQKFYDTCHFIFEYDKFAASLDFSISVYEKNFEQSLILVAEKGTIKFDDNFTKLSFLNLQKKIRSNLLNKFSKKKQNKISSFLNFYLNVYRNVKRKHNPNFSLKRTLTITTLINKMYDINKTHSDRKN